MALRLGSRALRRPFANCLKKISAASNVNEGACSQGSEPLNLDLRSMFGVQEAPAWANSNALQSRSFRSTSSAQKSIEVEIQSMGESITEGTIAEILKKEGDAVEEDETIAQIETDKVTVDVKAPAAGQLSELRVSSAG